MKPTASANASSDRLSPQFDCSRKGDKNSPKRRLAMRAKRMKTPTPPPINTDFCFFIFQSLNRQEQRLIDADSLREAVINAFVHNDYTDLMSPAFYIFSDRLDIVSYGGLIDGMSLEELVSGCSRPRNREIMRIFKDVDFVEQLGTGMNRMMKAYTPDIFNVSPNFFHTIFEYQKLDDAQQYNVAVNVAEELTERQANILNLIQSNVAVNVAVNTKFLSDKLNVNRKTVQRVLAELSEKKLIKWIGSDKTGHWEVITNKQ